MLGAPRRVADAYRQGVAEEEGRLHREAKEQRLQEDGAEPQNGVEGSARWGSRQAEIEAVRMLDAGGQERYHLESGDAITFEIDVRCREPLTDFVFGVGVSTPRGTEAWGTNTHLEGFTSEALEGATTVRLFCPALRLAPGEYLLDVAVHARDGYPYDYRRSILGFTVTSPHGGVGIYFPEHRWEFDPSVRWKKRP
jgi:lipopolysaccharide transport system ATP-binding protein